MVSRRHFLVSTIGALCAGSGCTQLSGRESSLAVSFESIVLAQARENEPPTVNLRVHNDSSEALTLSSDGHQPFMYFPRLDGEAGSMVLLPESSGELGADVASTQQNGCWRFLTPEGDEPDIVIRMDEDKVELPPDRAYTVRHELYYKGADRCFPDGEYSKQQSIQIEAVEEGNTREILTETTVTIDQNAITDVSIDGPI